MEHLIGFGVLKGDQAQTRHGFFYWVRDTYRRHIMVVA
jgi:hypothetical protein